MTEESSSVDRILRFLDSEAEELVEAVEEQLLDHLIYGTPLPIQLPATGPGEPSGTTEHEERKDHG